MSEKITQNGCFLKQLLEPGEGSPDTTEEETFNSMQAFETVANDPESPICPLYDECTIRGVDILDYVISGQYSARRELDSRAAAACAIHDVVRQEDTDMAEAFDLIAAADESQANAEAVISEAERHLKRPPKNEQ